MKKDSPPVLVIFIDALPFERGSDLAAALGSASYKKVTPGVGYSINVKTELFSGINPDEVGYFCEWNYTGKRELGMFPSWCLTTGSKIITAFSLFDKIAHRIVKMLIKKPVYGIPLGLLPYMRFSGPTAYEHDFAKPTFLSENEFRRVLYSELGVDDRIVFDEALRILEEECPERLFVSTAQLDGVMHAYGMNCSKYEDQIELINNKVETLVNKFIQIHGEKAKYFVFSDHGMAPVTTPVEFDIEAIIGKPKPGRYGYFIDATFFRVWIEDNSLRPALEEGLESLAESGHGIIFGQAEREKYGLTNAIHGDYIFMLHEGRMFCPSFFGHNMCQAMHGYEPKLSSQQGTFLSNVAHTQDTLEAPDVFKSVNVLFTEQ